MKNNPLNFNKLLPHLLIIAGFWIVSILYVFPVIEGKQMLQTDVVQSKSAAQQNVEYRKETGKISLWAESMFSGMPSFMIVMDYPNSWTTHLGRLFISVAPQPANIIFWYLLGAYLMFCLLGYNRWLAVLGSIGYAFASYNIISIEAGHISKCLAIAFAPPFIASVVLAYQGKIWLGSILAGIFAGVQLYANHVQITYYVLISLFLYVLFELIFSSLDKENRKSKLLQFSKATGFLIVAGLLAIGTHASRLWTTYEYSAQTNRGKSELSPPKKDKKDKKSDQNGTEEDETNKDRNYAFQWSYGISESLTFLIPNFQGGGTGSGAILDKNSNTYRLFQDTGLNPEGIKGLPFYWGAQPFTSGPAYWGAVIVFLFVFSLLISKDKIKWWLLTVTVLFVFLAWGKNLAFFNYLMYDMAPLFNKFRAHTMILSIVQIFVGWMLVLGLQSFFSKDFDKTKALRKLQISAGAVGGIALLIALIGGGFQDFKSQGTTQIVGKDGKIEEVTQDFAYQQNIIAQLGENKELASSIMNAIEDDRAAMQRSDAWRSFIFILLASVLVWLFLIDKLKVEYAIGGLILLASIDLINIDRRYLNNENFVRKSQVEEFYEPTEADRQIKEAESKNKTLHYRVLNTTRDPFQDALPSYFHNSVGGYHAAKLRRYQELIERHLSKSNFQVLNMLNTLYFIGNTPDGSTIAQKNPNVLGNAWFVEEYKIVKNADEEINSLEKFEPKKIAFIDRRFQKQLGNLKISPDTKASIRLVSVVPDELKYETQTNSPQIAIFSEIYYVNEGQTEWQAYLDGKPVPHFRANYVLRGIVVPAGKHTLEFKFVSHIYQKGETIALICSILLFLFVLLGAYQVWKIETTQS